MAPFDECSVLLPSATLEDFPVGGSESDACSLLAGWSALWHPKLLAQTEQLPTWYRADAPPTPDGPRVIVVPDPSKDQVPSDFRRKCDANPGCLWVTGADRGEMLAALKIDLSDAGMGPLEISGRRFGIEDFFAAGYLMLQVKIMTRRLRYTSNLDELHLQSRIVEAAKAFGDRNAEATVEGLHDVFDCLSEERDHYFSTDPHLVDLTLLTPGVLDSAIDSGWIERMRASARADDEANGVLGTPRNVLVDGAVAEAMCAEVLCGAKNDANQSQGYDEFRKLLQQETVGWAGGGPALGEDKRSSAPSKPAPSEPAPSEPAPSKPAQTNCQELMTMASARRAFETGTSLAEQAIGVAPTVYARLSGLTPVDFVPTLSALGYKGVIPIDFAAGTGFGDESKVIVSGGGSELEALTAKPIDAGSELAFLSIGAHLGESIDSGEIATALLVHWPDRVCDSFRDLCCAATWSAALGRFWTLDRYFTDGERPYHNGTLEALSGTAAAVVAETLADRDAGVSMQSMAETFRESVRLETDRTSRGIAMLAVPRLLDESESEDEDSVSDEAARRTLCEAIGVEYEPGREKASDVLCFNPHGFAIRAQTVLQGGSPPDEAFVYAASDAGHGASDVTFDVPAMGFTRLSATRSVKRTSLLKRLTRRNKGIAEAAILRNEFMAVSLDESSGAIAGVYSASRGNRLSMRLVAAGGLSGSEGGGAMICRRLEMIHSDLKEGIIKSSGELQNDDGESIAQFTLRYRLERGSRLLQVEGTLDPTEKEFGASAADLWKNYFAIRTAVAGEASILRSLVRDKVHSSSAKKIVAPLGVLIDEAEKQTLVCSHGLPLHRKVGDRFLDTLVGLPGRAAGESNRLDFQVTYALDCPEPVTVARACISPAKLIPVASAKEAGQRAEGKTEQAWLVHVSAADVLVTEMSTKRRRDGKLATRMQLVQTRPKTAKVKLQFSAFAHAAFVSDRSGIDRTLLELPEDVRCDDGVVLLTIGSHEAIDLVVVFDL